MNLLFTDPKKINWDQMPFPKKWFDSILADKVGAPRGFLKAQAFEHKDEIAQGFIGPGKLVYEFADENQVMYWLKHSFAMLEAGIFFKDAGEHKGYNDNEVTTQSESNLPAGWHYIVPSGQYVYSTHVWKNSTGAIAINNDIVTDSNLFPFFPTKMRFGTGGPVDITSAIDPSGIALNDSNAQGAGNTGLPPGGSKLNFIMIDRATKIALSTTGYSLSSPSGYYADYGDVFKNISIYQVTMPASKTDYCYDGKSINEAGLFCDASLTGTVGGLHDMPNGMILAKRYFSPIQKTTTISINFQWSIVK